MICVDALWWKSRRRSATLACWRGLAGQLPLKALELLLGPAREAGAVDLRPVGQDREGGQPEVDTDTDTGVGVGLGLGEDVRPGVHDEAEVADLGHVHRAVTLKGEGVGVEADRLPGVLRPRRLPLTESKKFL